jgi:hypothetical protein
MSRLTRLNIAFVATLLSGATAFAQDLGTPLDAAITTLEPRVIEWRRDLHQNPELSNREFRTSKIVAEHLKRLGLEVQTGIAKTGVIGVLKGGKPGLTDPRLSSGYTSSPTCRRA